MRWFKFYGQDFLTDSKLMDFNCVERLLWVYILSIANAEDKNGIIPHLTEEKLFRYANISSEEDRKLGKGILQKLIDNKMLKMITDDDNKMITDDDNDDNKYLVINWKKLQNKNLSGYERVKKYRSKKARIINLNINKHDNTNDNVHDNTNDNINKTRLDKTRLDKKRIYKEKENIKEKENSFPLSPLKEKLKTRNGTASDPPDPPEDIISVFLERFNVAFGAHYRITDGRKTRLRARLKKYSLDEILIAVANLSQSNFHKGKNDRNWRADPDFLLRSDEQIDKWLNVPTAQAPPKLLSKLIPDV